MNAVPEISVEEMVQLRRVRGRNALLTLVVAGLGLPFSQSIASFLRMPHGIHLLFAAGEIGAVLYLSRFVLRVRCPVCGTLLSSRGRLTICPECESILSDELTEEEVAQMGLKKELRRKAPLFKSS